MDAPPVVRYPLGMSVLTHILALLGGCTPQVECAPGLVRIDGYCLSPEDGGAADTDGGGAEWTPRDSGSPADTGAAPVDADVPEGMVRVPATTATLGCVAEDQDCHSPLQWEATLSRDLFVDRTEVTRGEWESFFGPRAWPDDCGPDCPATALTWYEAAFLANARSESEGLQSCYTCAEVGGFLQCLQAVVATSCDGYRLPTEAEWEIAARCGEDHSYAGSDQLDTVSWSAHNSGGVLHPVAGLAPNACGLHDMSGNAWEWTQDWYVVDAEITGGVDPLGGVVGNERVARGGSYDFEYLTHTVHFRDRCRRPDMIMADMGLRLVRTAPSDVPKPRPGDLVRLEAGTFDLGCTPGQVDCRADETAHRVTLSRPFWIDVSEVTQSAYLDLTGAAPSRHGDCGEDCPVELISWHEAAQATNRRSAAEGLDACYVCSGEGEGLACTGVEGLLDCTGYRLPTSAEWEVAARCGADQPFPGGDTAEWVAWTRETAAGAPRVVAQLLPNACGLVDMGGNVSEWVHDGAGEQPAESTDPTGSPSSDRRLTRGGGWDTDASWARVPAVHRRDATNRSSAVGFRMARTAAAE